MKDNLQTESSDISSIFVRQLRELKQIVSSLKTLSLAQIGEKLKFCINMAQKVTPIQLQNYHLSEDYIIDFYQQSLKDLRLTIDTLNKQKQIHQKEINELHLEINVLRDTSQLNCLKDNTKNQYKNQLSHTQLIINENNQLISQQQALIQQLNEKLKKSEEAQKIIRKTAQNKIKSMDQTINRLNLAFNKTINTLENQEKKMNDHGKRLDLMNLHLVDQLQQFKDALQIKNLQIKLLSKKIYELSQEIKQKTSKNMVSDRLVRSVEEQLSELEGELFRSKLKYSEVGKEWQKKVKEKIIQIQKLEQKEVIFEMQNKELQQQKYILQRKVKQLQDQIHHSLNNKGPQTPNDPHNNQEYQIFIQKLQQQNKQFQQHYDQTINQLYLTNNSLQNQVQQARQKHWEAIQKHQNQKQTIRKDINLELEKLININQTLERKNQESEKKISELEYYIEQLQKNKSQLSNSFGIATETFEKLNTRTEKLQKDKNNAIQTKELLELHLQKANQEIARLAKLINKGVHPIQQQSQQQTSRNLKQKGKETELKVKNQIDQMNRRYLKSCEEVEKVKQQLNLRMLQNAELKSKVKELNEEIRVCKISICEDRDRMCYKIKQLQGLLRERYSFESNNTIELC